MVPRHRYLKWSYFIKDVVLWWLPIITMVGSMWLIYGNRSDIGWAIAVSLLVLENSLVTAADLSKLRSPMFQYNSAISMVLLLFTALAVAL